MESLAGGVNSSADLYRSIGVRPVINARGTFTIISGSQTLPEVKQAMDEASRSYVQMDELMDGVGKRLAELTEAEWGIVTNGCCAALTHCTSASHCRHEPGTHAASPGPDWTQKRSHHSGVLAKCVRSCDSNGRREDHGSEGEIRTRVCV